MNDDSIPQLKLDPTFEIKLPVNLKEWVHALTSADGGETFGYLLAGSEEDDALSQRLVDRINAKAPKVQAILDVIRTKPDRGGNQYYAFRYTRCQDGKQVVATISGGDSNISAAKGLAGLHPSANVYYTYHEMGYQEFCRLTANWSYAGCQPKSIAEFIVEGLATPLYERPMLAYDKASKRYAIFDQFTMLQEYKPGTEVEALVDARKFFGRTIVIELIYPSVTKVRMS